MVSRIDLGPDGGPYVEIDEDAGDLVIRVPNDTVDFDSNDLLNAVLQNATMDGGSLDGVSLASALDANNQDLNSVGTASVTALEAGTISVDSSAARYHLNDDIDLQDDTITDVGYDVEVIDNIGEFDSESGSWTPNEDGVYLLIHSVNFTASSPEGEITAIMGGDTPTQFSYAFKASGSGVSATLTTLTSLSASDSVKTQARQSTGGEMALRGNASHTRFTVVKVA